ALGRVTRSLAHSRKRCRGRGQTERAAGLVPAVSGRREGVDDEVPVAFGAADPCPGRAEDAAGGGPRLRGGGVSHPPPPPLRPTAPVAGSTRAKPATITLPSARPSSSGPVSNIPDRSGLLMLPRPLTLRALPRPVASSQVARERLSPAKDTRCSDRPSWENAI